MTNPLRDGFTIFDRLFSLPCEKIYVSGNHDEDIANYKGTYLCDNDSKFDVVHGHYPENPRSCLKVRKRTYFFLHGYQFDQVFESAATRKGLEIWARLSSASPELDPWIVPTGSSLFLLSLLRRNWIRLVRTAPSIVAIPVLFIWFVLWIILGISVLAWVGRRLQDLFYRAYPDHLRYEREPSRFERLTGNARLVNIDDLVERHYYKKHMDTTTADVIVFGHTHVPQRPTRPPHAEKTFINTGSWVPSGLYTYNTFVYVDEAGPLLLQWCDNTKTVREVPLDEDVMEL
jgi:UDP-2,3-diacylglucosamine pyrophosphatase LpxH